MTRALSEQADEDDESRIVVTRSAAETQRFGASLAIKLQPGDCVGLDGDLGAGKTCLIQGICTGFGVRDPVTSPTFVLINEYAGRDGGGRPLMVYHFDLYRLGGVDELIDLGCEDYFYGEGVCLIEWAAYAGDVLPETAWRIQMDPLDACSRTLTVRGGRR